MFIISSTRAFVQIRCNLHHSSSTQWWKSIKCFIYITCIKQQSNWFENKYICLKTNRTISIIFLLLMNNFVLHLCFLVPYPPLSPLFVGDFVSFFSNWRFWWRWWGPAELGPSAQPKSPTLTQNKNAEKIIFIFFRDDCKEQTVVLMLSTFSSIGQELFYLEKNVDVSETYLVGPQLPNCIIIIILVVIIIATFIVVIFSLGSVGINTAQSPQCVRFT